MCAGWSWSPTARQPWHPFTKKLFQREIPPENRELLFLQVISELQSVGRCVCWAELQLLSVVQPLRLSQRGTRRCILQLLETTSNPNSSHAAAVKPAIQSTLI